MKRYAGLIAWLILALATSLWTFWGISEMYYEGWGLPFPQPAAYLLPAVACLLFTALALWRTRLAGWVIVAGGGAFTVWWWTMAFTRSGGLSLGAVLAMFPVSGALVLVGLLFLWDAKHPQHFFENHRIGRHWRALLGFGPPLLILVGVSAAELPVVLTRWDDGGRGARLVEGNGVTLVWAPSGPGWNWKQPWGGYPSWDSLARYGQAPIGLKTGEDLGAGHATETEMQTTGLCAYLNADGTRLMAEPQYIWRMPAAEEIVRSLTRDGVNAGCTPPSGEGKAECERTPDKETPLWAPDQPPIYYWTAEEFNADEAWYVSYNGNVLNQEKDWGNPRHGYRCVCEP